METRKIEIEIPDGKKAEWVNGVLTLVDEKPKDVTERIKTYENAEAELMGKKNKLLREYINTIDVLSSPDILAYLKLRIICAALNEGWQPKFTENERRYYPWLWLYTQDEIDNMNEYEKKNRGLMSTDNYQTSFVGFGCACSDVATSSSDANINSRLCLKNSDLAVYCGKQFINLWADYLLPRKK